MVPSFEFFDVKSSRRAYFSAADQERAGYLAEITHGSRFESVKYDNGLDLCAKDSALTHATLGVS